MAVDGEIEWGRGFKNNPATRGRIYGIFFNYSGVADFIIDLVSEWLHCQVRRVACPHFDLLQLTTPGYSLSVATSSVVLPERVWKVRGCFEYPKSRLLVRVLRVGRSASN